MPEKPASALAEDWRSSVRGLLNIYRVPAFWRLAPLSACVIGTAFAVHGLWAARWLTDVNGFAEGSVTYLLLVMGGGLTIGAIVIGFAADRLRHNGVPPMVTFGMACAVFIGLQVALLGRLPLPAWLIWGVIGGFGGMTVLSYSIMGELFPPEKIGRANGALNVLHLSMAFILQYGMGVAASSWPAEPSGHLPFAAYRAAFALPLLLELLALAWFVVSITQRRRAGAIILAGLQPEVSG
nr:MFS transporter [uncultured Rhodopila sp.]